MSTEILNYSSGKISAKLERSSKMKIVPDPPVGVLALFIQIFGRFLCDL